MPPAQKGKRSHREDKESQGESGEEDEEEEEDSDEEEPDEPDESEEDAEESEAEEDEEEDEEDEEDEAEESEEEDEDDDEDEDEEEEEDEDVAQPTAKRKAKVTKRGKGSKVKQVSSRQSKQKPVPKAKVAPRQQTQEQPTSKPSTKESPAEMPPETARTEAPAEEQTAAETEESPAETPPETARTEVQRVFTEQGEPPQQLTTQQRMCETLTKASQDGRFEAAILQKSGKEAKAELQPSTTQTEEAPAELQPSTTQTEEADVEEVPATMKAEENSSQSKSTSKKGKAKTKARTASSTRPSTGQPSRPSSGTTTKRSGSRSPTQQATKREEQEGGSSPSSPSHPEPEEKSGRKKGGKVDSEGVKCVQTLELGCAIRSAFCIGKEVWAVDWKGSVTIRQRDDASRIISEVPTGRFVWAMAHMEPGLMWMGQEAQGISVFDSKKKELRGVLTGGHSGGVTCLALDETLADGENGRFPRRRAWSGSNDFTIREWWVDTWHSKDTVPDAVNRDPAAFVAPLGKLRVGITRGHAMHGHKNGLRALLRIGPTLWSGSDDASIRLWSTTDGSCLEVVEDAHKGSVLRLCIVRSAVWSAGEDGLVKEWNMLGRRRSCIRQVAPPDSGRGVYSLVPLGHDVWVAGHHPSIQVFSQEDMELCSKHEAHQPYVSNLMTVDTIFTRVVWSTSLGDRKLKVWKHTLRGSMPSVDELKAANRMYEEEEQNRADRFGDLHKSIEDARKQLDDLAQELAQERSRSQDLEASRKELQDELDRLRQLFEEAGLGHLLQDPEALKRFLGLKQLFDEAGLGHLLEDPEALKQFLGLKKLFEEAGLGHLLQDPEALKSFLALKKLFEEAGLGHLLQDPEALKRFLALAQAFKDAGRADLLDDPEALKDFLGIGSVFDECGLGHLIGDNDELRTFLQNFTRLQETLEKLGLEHLLDDPEELGRQLERLKQYEDILKSYGRGDVIEDPSLLAEILSRYTGLEKTCGEYGFDDLFDPCSLKGFLRNYAKIKEAFAEQGLEYLLDSAGAMRDFLQEHCKGKEEAKGLRAAVSRLQEVERSLAERDKQLADALADLKKLREQLAEYTALGDVQSLKDAKANASAYRALEKARAALEEELAQLKAMLEQKERERLEALEKERMMALQYKELDIFKLDIIARELKALDQELGMVGKQARAVEQDAGKLKNYEEQRQMLMVAEKVPAGMHALRAHIRDVINKCLSETQKLHVGIAIDDHLAAGELKDGGVMAGWVMDEVDVPVHGNSRAAKLRHRDESHRDKAPQSPAGSGGSVTLPSLTPRR